MLNPRIISILFKTGEIESFGSGFERTFDECEKENILYEYENTKSGFKFTFFRKSEENEIILSEFDFEVLDCIKDNPFITNDELAEKFNKSPKTIYRSIKKLKEKGMVKRIGSSFDGSWEIIE